MLQASGPRLACATAHGTYQCWKQDAIKPEQLLLDARGMKSRRSFSSAQSAAKSLCLHVGGSLTPKEVTGTTLPMQPKKAGATCSQHVVC